MRCSCFSSGATRTASFWWAEFRAGKLLDIPWTGQHRASASGHMQRVQKIVTKDIAGAETARIEH